MLLSGYAVPSVTPLDRDGGPLSAACWELTRRSIVPCGRSDPGPRSIGSSAVQLFQCVGVSARPHLSLKRRYVCGSTGVPDLTEGFLDVRRDVTTSGARRRIDSHLVEVDSLGRHDVQGNTLVTSDSLDLDTG